jgi:SAM-dependent methyltransferase
VEFEEYKQSYVAEVEQSIDFSGQSHDFFIRVKADELVASCNRQLGTLEQRSILDVGCGVGLMSRYVGEHFGELHGVDIAPGVVERAAENFPRGKFQLYDGKSIPFDEQSFDVAFTVCVLHHVPPEQWTSLVTEMARVLKPGGLLYIFEHNPYNPLTRRAVNHCPFDADATLLTRSLLSMEWLRLSTHRIRPALAAARCSVLRVRAPRRLALAASAAQRRWLEPFQASQCALRCMVPAHPVHAAPGWRGCGADEHACVRRRVWIEPRHGSREELEDVSDAACNRAADVVWVVSMKVVGVHRVPGKNAVLEARRETLDLVLDRFRHVHRGAARNVAVRVARMLAFGRSTRVELALLTEQNIGSLGMPP